MAGERGFATREHMCVHAPDPGVALPPQGVPLPLGRCSAARSVCGGAAFKRERGSKRETLTCPRTLMDTMFGSASLLSAFTLSSALLIVSLRLCGVVREQEARWGGALM
jgi:hypothetical protein